jgi:transmembrane sensor
MNAIDEQAVRWVVRVASGSLPVDAQRELQGWLDADLRHRGAYVRAQAHWVALDRLGALHGVHPTQPAVARAATRISRRQWLGAAAAALAAGSGGLSWMLVRGRRQHYHSDIGELRRIALADGSTVMLNTASDMLVEFDEHQRRIALMRGEALFDVAPDPARPFVVLTEAMAVRAVGTAFDVRLGPSHMYVTVTEGTVELRHPLATSLPEGRRVTVNQRAVVLGQGRVEVRTIAAADAERQLAWREGLVSFNKETLQSAVTEINRYNHRQIVIDDPVLAASPVVGVFRTTELDDFALAAARALGATVIVDRDWLRLRGDATAAKIEPETDPTALPTVAD